MISSLDIEHAKLGFGGNKVKRRIIAGPFTLIRNLVIYQKAISPRLGTVNSSK